MFKHAIFFLFALAALSPAVASDIVTVTFFTNDGAQVAYAMDDKPKFEFRANNKYLYLYTPAERVFYPVSNLRKFTFSDDPTAINETNSSNQRAERNGGELSFAGYKSGTAISVHDTAGKLVLKATASEDGTASMSLSGLPKGVYIVKAGNVSMKITR